MGSILNSIFDGNQYCLKEKLFLLAYLAELAL